MTYIFLARAYLANPGFVPLWLKTPLNANREAPLNLVRIYNMRFWMANRIHSFEEFVEHANDDENIEISFST